MDIGDQLPEIAILLAKDRFVPVLKKMPVAAMPPVEAHRIAGQKPAHGCGDRPASGAQQQMGVSAYQRPCITGGLRFGEPLGQPVQKVLPVVVVFENRCLLDSADDDMVQGPRGIDAGLAGHGTQILK